MADYGIKFIKNNTTINERTKKNFNLLNTVDSHKIIFANYITTGSYDHNLGFVPFFLVFEVDSGGTPSFFTANKNGRASSSQITNLPNPCYLIIFKETK